MPHTIPRERSGMTEWTEGGTRQARRSGRLSSAFSRGMSVMGGTAERRTSTAAWRNATGKSTTFGGMSEAEELEKLSNTFW